MLQTAPHAAHAASAGPAADFLPHGFCYQWNPALLLTHVAADLLIGGAYVVISVALAVLVHRARRDIPFSRLFVAFGLFIVACGLTHFIEVWTLWQPVYWLAGAVKVVTAVASVTTAAVLPGMVPVVHGTVRDARSARAREVAAAADAARAAALEEQNAALAAQAAELARERGVAQALAADLARANGDLARANAELEGANAALARTAAEAQRHADALEATYRSAPVGLCVLDAELRFVRVNDRLAAMNGPDAAAHLGRTVREVLPALADAAEPVLRRVLATGEPRVGVEITGETPAAPGVARTWVESWYPLRDGAGAVVGVNVVAEDVTERRRAEVWLNRTVGELQAANADLARLTDALQAANDGLAAANVEARAARAVAEQASEAKTQFLATMSHELRTPLNAVLGYVDLLGVEEIAGPLTAAQRGYLDRVGASARHLLGLIDEVLDLAKVEAGQMTVALHPTAPQPEVLAAAALVRPQAAAKAIALAVEAPGAGDAEWRVVADAGRLRQVLVNLLGNAVKFTEPGGRVAVRLDVGPADDAPLAVERAGGRVARLVVEDTGIGIPSDRLEAVFEPFVQVEARDGAAPGSVYTRRHGGTGLGLAIGRRLARLMGGDLTAESTLGVGSRFTLWLPLAPPVRHTPVWTPAVAAPSAAPLSEPLLLRAPA